MEDEKGIFSKMSLKTGFFAGLGSALAVFFVIGFFVLLVIVLGGDNSNNDSDIAKDGDNPSVAGERAGDDSAPTEIPLAQVSDNDWIRGNKDAKISIVEFSDIECPFCSRFHDTMKQVLEAYPEDVNWVYRHLPLPSLHPNAPKDAEAAECVGEIGGEDAFWEYLDTLYASELSSTSQLSALAVGIGIDAAAFDACFNSGTFTSKVKSQSDDGAKAADASSRMDNDPSNDGRWGTPFSVIVAGDEKVPVPGAYPFDYVKQVVDSLLEQ